MLADILELQTEKGTVYIEGPAPGEYLESLSMNQQLNNFRPAGKQKEALINISKIPQGMIYIARHQKEIIGYVTFHQPDEYTRWSKHPRILEMGGIEISPEWRKYKIGLNLLKVAFSAKPLEDFIVITMEYAWHWDLRSSGLDVWKYQKMLTGMFSRAGLSKVSTDDPDILEHPCNVLMAKIGPGVSKQDILLFESMRFMSKYGEAVQI
ncbi:GNAT family N-acetyltransferase [Desulfocucumis palustris]|nr:GNAT family N-acetyltransferase [Desulfocucumis palustris]